ncbi:MAG: hypothetical protein HDT43_01735 [Ruminococcaceae bacterium]|nr:hypothetical protein [Oscillospiraceae bacterium]
MDFDTISLYIRYANSIKEMQLKLDKSLCDMTAKASLQDDSAVFNRWAALLFLRLDELDKRLSDELRRYVNEKLNEGAEEYRAALAIFSAEDIRDIMI